MSAAPAGMVAAQAMQQVHGRRTTGRMPERSARFNGPGDMFVVIRADPMIGVCASAHAPGPDGSSRIIAMTTLLPYTSCRVIVSGQDAMLWVGDVGFQLRDPRQAQNAATFIGKEVANVSA